MNLCRQCNWSRQLIIEALPVSGLQLGGSENLVIRQNRETLSSFWFNQSHFPYMATSSMVWLYIHCVWILKEVLKHWLKWVINNLKNIKSQTSHHMANGLQQQSAGVSSGLQLSRWETHDGWVVVATKSSRSEAMHGKETKKKKKQGQVINWGWRSAARFKPSDWTWTEKKSSSNSREMKQSGMRAGFWRYEPISHCKYLMSFLHKKLSDVSSITGRRPAVLSADWLCSLLQRFAISNTVVLSGS